MGLSLVIFVVLLGQSQRFYNEIIQFGDPFTYVSGYFELLDNSRGGVTSLVEQLNSVLNGDWNWYWFQNIFIILFSPFLSKDESNIAIINFLLFGFSSYLLNLILIKLINPLKNVKNLSYVFLLSLTPWLLPINYGYIDYSSLQVLGLDSSFIPLVSIALFSSILFLLNLSKMRWAVAAGFFVGLAIWARGNSIIIVGFVLFPIYLKTLLKTFKFKTYLNTFIYSVMALIMSVTYYFQNWNAISSYYLNHLTFVERVDRNFDLLTPYLLNIPGYMLIPAQNNVFTIILSYILHLLTILILIRALSSKTLSEESKNLKFLTITGFFIYWGTYVINLILWVDPLITLQNALLIWRPMLIGLILLITCYLVQFVNKLNSSIKFNVHYIQFISLFSIIMLAVVLNKFRTPDELRGATPPPMQVIQVAEYLKNQSGEEPVSILWLQPKGYSPTLLNYYYRKYFGKTYFITRGQYYNNLWSPIDYSDNAYKKILEELVWQFSDSGVIVVPKDFDMYSDSNGPYAFYKKPFLIQEALTKANLNWSYQCIGLIEDTRDSYLLILRKVQKTEVSGKEFIGWTSTGLAKLDYDCTTVFKYTVRG